MFGSYLVSGGSIDVLVEALPFELWTIGGAAVASFVMANSMHDLKHALGGFKKIFGGAAFKKATTSTCLSLLYFLVRLATTKGNMALEPHIEKPDESAAFQKFPKVLANHFASSMICDYLRMVGMNADDPNQIEDVMARELKKTLNEELHGAHALQTMADGLPALGIVAAVLGVIKTMSHIDRPPAVLGAMIAQRAVRHVPWRAAGLRSGRSACGAAEKRGRGGGEILRGDPRRPGDPPARQRAAGQRGVRPQDGAQRAHADVPGAGGGGAVGADRLAGGSPSAVRDTRSTARAPAASRICAASRTTARCVCRAGSRRPPARRPYRATSAPPAAPARASPPNRRGTR